jgi:acetylxylan esterase
MYVYIPTTISTPAPIIVAIHYCSGSASAYFSQTQYAALADTHGYIVIYPSAASSGSCWDVASSTSLTHGEGGDSLTIVNMVSYAVENFEGDASNVFVTGSSSGAMMTNVLAGAYPDVFQAASVYSGVPDGCFYLASATAEQSTPGWNSQCSTGFEVKTAQEWGNLVRSYYTNYSGPYPKMQMYVLELYSSCHSVLLQTVLTGYSFHGTADTTLAYSNLAEEMKQWSNVLGVSFTKNVTNTPTAGYTQMVYGNGTELVGYSGLDVGHTVPVHEDMDLAWFGII